MTSFRQIEANRRNARKSTGPTTEKGKQRSRCNAVRHGLTAETVIGALEDAEHAYAEVAPGYPGAEARLRYALLLKRRGNLDEARRMLKDLLDGAKLGPPHYRRAQAQWLDLARREL